MDDAINLAKSGQLDYETALGLTGYLSKEEEYVPWFSALKGLSYIDNMLKEKKAHGLFKKLVFSFTKLKKRTSHFQVHAASARPHLQEAWLQRSLWRHPF